MKKYHAMTDLNPNTCLYIFKYFINSFKMNFKMAISSSTHLVNIILQREMRARVFDFKQFFKAVFQDFNFIIRVFPKFQDIFYN